jgi:TonB family protein
MYRVFFLILSAALCSAQNNVAPRALLEEIATAGSQSHAWRADGTETSELTGEGMNLHTEIIFQAVFRDPLHVRWETTGDNRSLMVCDGVDHWNYAEPGTGFYRNPVEASPCRSQLPAFDSLMDNLVSVTLAGGDRVPFEGVSRDCDNVRAEYLIPASGSRGAAVGTTIVRTLCVDPARRLILRDRTESWATGSNARFTQTIVFNSYQRDVEIPDDAFRFEVRTGTFLDPGPQIAEEDLSPSDGTYHVVGGVSRPQLIKKVEPSWTEETLQAGVSGLVLVSLSVDADGIPRDLSVTRKLGYGFDEKALEAVRRWRFRPGMKNGAPVAVRNLTVAVNFRRP